MEQMNPEQRHIRRQAQRRMLRRRRQRALAIVFVLLSVVLVISFADLSATKKRPAQPSGALQPLNRHSPKRHNPPRTAVGDARPGDKHVPILMYHVINAPPPGAPFPGLYVTPSEFSEQMQALASSGYHAVTMNQVLDYWKRGTPLPPGKPIVLSFDNGYQSQYTQALPVLHKLGWVGVENLQLSGLPPSQGGLSRTQVRGLLDAGWELDTQGFSHADLITLSPSELHYQVAVARQTIQRRYHVAASWFCYPSGHYNATVVAAVKAAGYVGSTTVVPGWAGAESDPYRLPRLRVLGGTSPEALLTQISSIRTASPPPPSYGST